MSLDRDHIRGDAGQLPARGRGGASIGHLDGRRLVERLVELMNGGDIAALDDLFADDFVDHDPMPGPAGVAGVRLGLEMLSAQGENVRFHLEDCFSSGDRVAYRMFGTWTVPPELVFQRELAPAATVSLSGVGIYKCRAGRLAERWGTWSLLVDGDAVSLRPVREGGL